VLSGEEEIAGATSSANDCGMTGKDDHGPFDIIGDVHGCYVELVELLASPGTRQITKEPPPVTRTGRPERCFSET